MVLEGGYSLLHLPLANLAIVEALAGLPASFDVDPGRRRRAARAARGRARRGRGGGARRAGAAAIHATRGWWIADAGSPAVLPPLEGDQAADVVVIGGGYTGLWAAWHVLAAEPGARVVGLEAGRCGHGPAAATAASSTHGALPPRWSSASAPRRRRRGSRRRRRPCGRSGRGARPRASTRWYRTGGRARRLTAPAQDGVGAAAVDGDEVVALDAARRAGAVDSPWCAAACSFARRPPCTRRVWPSACGSAAGPRRGDPRGHAGARPAGRAGGVVVETGRGGRVRARAAIVAVNAASGHATAPARPADRLLEPHRLHGAGAGRRRALGWTGGESVTDGRALFHYTRTTRDGRIVFGWAGGRMAAGARRAGAWTWTTRSPSRHGANLLRFFPQLEGRRIAHAWGGPIDVSPTHLPVVAACGLPAWAAFGYTGNGVALPPAGRVMAMLALDRRDAVTRLPFVDAALPRVPPEPFRVAGAAVIRRALARKEAAEEAGGWADPVTRAVAAPPAVMGLPSCADGRAAGASLPRRCACSPWRTGPPASTPPPWPCASTSTWSSTSATSTGPGSSR